MDFARDLKKKMWNMKITLIPIVFGALGTINEALIKGLKKIEIRGQVEAIETISLLRSIRILRRVLET